MYQKSLKYNVSKFVQPWVIYISDLYYYQKILNSNLILQIFGQKFHVFENMYEIIKKFNGCFLLPCVS